MNLSLRSKMEDKTDIAPTHLLLIGDTKTGKSTYVAQAAIDGATVFYLDSDNGLSALKRALAGHEDAWDRVIHVPTDTPATFIDEMFNTGRFRWNLTSDRTFSRMSSQPDDDILEVIPSKMPPGLLFCVDSWTSVALDAMIEGAAKKSLKLSELQNDGQAIYGDANRKLTLICAIIQHMKCDVVVQAHRGFYERYEKPLNHVGPVKQKDMVLKETIEIPLSSSRPHGLEIGKYFTDIGWLEINRMDERVISFKPKYQRVSGGTINKEGSLKELSYKNCFGIKQAEISDSWIRSKKASEIIAAASGASTGNDSAIPAKPASSKLSNLIATRK